jgi:Uma2 family endonuclease
MSAVVVQRHRFSVDEYHRMGEAGLFGEDDRIELIEGEVVDMVPIGGPHVFLVNRLNRHFVRCGGEKVVVSVQNPIQLSDDTEPEPDLVLLDARLVSPNRVPDAAAALLVVEVADSSLAYDRSVKAQLYGQAGVPEYWLLNVEQRRLERFSAPTAEGYRESRFFLEGESLESERLPACRLDLSEVFAGL